MHPSINQKNICTHPTPEIQNNNLSSDIITMSYFYDAISIWKHSFQQCEAELEAGVGVPDVALDLAVKELKCERQNFEVAVKDVMDSLDELLCSIHCWYQAFRDADNQYNAADPYNRRIAFQHSVLEDFVEDLGKHIWGGGNSNPPATDEPAPVEPDQVSDVQEDHNETDTEAGDDVEHSTDEPEETVEPDTAALGETVKPDTTTTTEATEHNTTEPEETIEPHTVALGETVKHNTTTSAEAAEYNTAAPEETAEPDTAAPGETVKPDTTTTTEATERNTAEPEETVEPDTAAPEKTAEPDTAAPGETLKCNTTSPEEATVYNTSATPETAEQEADTAAPAGSVK
jgi:hypothetical protein